MNNILACEQAPKLSGAKKKIGELDLGRKKAGEPVVLER